MRRYSDEEILKVLNAEEAVAAFEMSELGRIGNLRISIYGKEGPVPHFHFYTNDGKIDGCLRFDKAAYFPHGHHTSTLDRKARLQIMNFLSSETDAGETEFYWDRAIRLWNENNPQYKITEKIEMPDYLKIEEQV